MLLLVHMCCFVLLSKAEGTVLTVIHVTALIERMLIHCFIVYQVFFFLKQGFGNVQFDETDVF